MALKTMIQANLDTEVASSALFWKSNGREGYRASLSGFDLSALTIAQYSCLVGVRLTKSKLNGMNLTGCDFTDCDGRMVLLRNANLTGADFSGADLYGADFTGANLTGADFSCAACQTANFTGATLTGARFDNSDRSGAV